MLWLAALVASLVPVASAPPSGECDVAGRTVTQLTRSGARNGQAFWSPDRRRIAFVSNRGGAWQVWIMAADGSRPRQLTHVEGGVGWPSWSHDGREIYFYGRTPAGFRLLRVNVDGGSIQPLLPQNAGQQFRPLLSPDGRRLMFDLFEARTGRNHDIVVVELQTGTWRRLASDPGYDSDARWSPSGERIAFHSDRGAAAFQTQVFVMDADGGAVRQLTRGPAKHSYPSWSPDGSRLAYVAEESGNRDVVISDVHGGNLVRATCHPGFDSEPVWAHDGKHLLIVTDRFGGQELATVTLE